MLLLAASAHVFTLYKHKAGPNFEEIVKRVKLEIDAGKMTNDKCLEMRGQLLSEAYRRRSKR